LLPASYKLLPAVNPHLTEPSASVKPVQKPTAPQHLQSTSNTAPRNTHPLLNPSADVRPMQKPTAPTQLQTQ